MKENIIKQLSLQEGELNKYQKKSVLPWVNWWRKRKIKQIILKFFKDIDIDSDTYGYRHIRMMAELYNFLKNTPYTDIPIISHNELTNYVMYLRPSVNSVYSGNDYVEIKLSFANVDDVCMTWDYDFIFYQSTTYIKKKESYNNTSICRSATIYTNIHYGTLEYYLLKNSFVEKIKELIKVYLTL